jgi:uncharacterized iron-regulated membrane protein
MNKINPSSTKKSTWLQVRKFLNDLHLWLGIGAGLILTIVCLTGTILAFEEEIKQVLNPSLYEVEVPVNAEKLSIEALNTKVTAQLPEGGRVFYVFIPHEVDAAYKVNYRPKEGKGSTYLVNPYSGEVLGNIKAKGSDFFMTVFRLHRWLLLDTEIGRPIVGVATIIFFFIIISGWVIWLPKKIKNWRQGLKIKWNANWKRVNFDLHSTLGFYASIFLLLMTLTGLKWSFKWYKDGVTDLLSSPKKEKVQYAYDNKKGEKLLNYAVLLDQINSELPYKGAFRVYIQSKKDNPFVDIHKYETGFFASSGQDRIKLNRFTGEIIELDDFSEKPLGDKIVASLYPIHVGSFYGMFTRILYFIACAIATTLPITGTIIWLNKLKKRSKKKVKLKQTA